VGLSPSLELLMKENVTFVREKFKQQRNKNLSPNPRTSEKATRADNHDETDSMV
jgi:hypothetical protein